MSTQQTLPFTPDNDGRAIQFQKSATGSVYAQVVVSKGGDINKASEAATTTAAISAATAESVLTADHKRVRVWVYNSHASKAARLIGAASQAGGYRLASGAGVWIEGGGAVFAFCEDGSATAITFEFFENRIEA